MNLIVCNDKKVFIFQKGIEKLQFKKSYRHKYFKNFKIFQN